jgi:hypothetical protein
MLKPAVCPTHEHGQDRSKPVCRLARLFEASSLLDKNHDNINRALHDIPVDLDELMLTIQAVYNLQTLVTEEIGDGIQLYSGGLNICNT